MITPGEALAPLPRPVTARSLLDGIVISDPDIAAAVIPVRPEWMDGREHLWLSSNQWSADRRNLGRSVQRSARKRRIWLEPGFGKKSSG